MQPPHWNSCSICQELDDTELMILSHCATHLIVMLHAPTFAPATTTWQGGQSAVEEWVELANGCLCCSVKSDFVSALEALMQKRDKFDYVLIETTGGGKPSPSVCGTAAGRHVPVLCRGGLTRPTQRTSLVSAASCTVRYNAASAAAVLATPSPDPHATLPTLLLPVWPRPLAPPQPQALSAATNCPAAAGLANPGPIAAALWTDQEVEAGVCLDATVTVVDAANIGRQLAEQRPGGGPNEAQLQIAYADLVLLNKVGGVRDSSGIEDLVLLTWCC